MIGKKFYKNNFDSVEYAKTADWCNKTQLATIEDKGEHYEVVEISEPSLEELKTTKLAELKATRNKLEIEPIEYNDKFFDYDNDSRDRISGAIIRLKKLGTEATISWTCADNTDIMVTYEDLENIVSNVADRANLLHIRYRKLRELVESAETKEDLDKIIWEEIDGN